MTSGAESWCLLGWGGRRTFLARNRHQLHVADGTVPWCIRHNLRVHWALILRLVAVCSFGLSLALASGRTGCSSLRQANRISDAQNKTAQSAKRAAGKQRGCSHGSSPVGGVEAASGATGVGANSGFQLCKTLAVFGLVALNSSR